MAQLGEVSEHPSGPAAIAGTLCRHPVRGHLLDWTNLLLPTSHVRALYVMHHPCVETQDSGRDLGRTKQSLFASVLAVVPPSKRVH